MITHLQTWYALKSDRRAMTALEYAMIAGIVVAVIAMGFDIFVTALMTQFNSVGNNL